MNKTEINKLLVEERKKMREKNKQSLFMRRTLSIFNGQKKRAAESLHVIPYTLEQFREWVNPSFENRYCDCGNKLSAKNMTIDHRVPVARGGNWGIDNLRVVCKPCNWRKGIFFEDEYTALIEFAETKLSPESRADLWRRLVSGGKMTFGK